MIDKRLNFKSSEVKREIEAGGAELMGVCSLPTTLGKLISPLDDCFWNDAKDFVLKEHFKESDNCRCHETNFHSA